MIEPGAVTIAIALTAIADALVKIAGAIVISAILRALLNK